MEKKDEAQVPFGLDGPGSGGTTSREARPDRNLELLEQKYQDGLSIRLLNLNYPPEIKLIGTVYNEVLASPATPATMKKSTRTQIRPPPEIFDFSDDATTYHNMVQNGFGTSQQATTEYPLELCLSEAGLASGIAYLQRQEHEINVVPPSEVIPLQKSEEGNQGIDFSKTPKQKASRKKHRPKVIREDKPARTPKPATPKPVTPRRARKTENTNQGKRKYVWKKNDLNSPEKFPNALGETVNLDGGCVNKSVRRSLNFNLDSQESDRCSTSEMLFTRNAESQAAVASSGTKSDVHSVQGRGIEVLENPLGEQFMFYLDSLPNRSRSEGLPEALKKLQADYISKINDLNKVLESSIGDGENLTKHAWKSNCLNVVGDLERSLEADEVHVVSDNISDVLLKGSKRCHDLVYDAQVSTEINLMHAHGETDRVSNNHDESTIDNCHKKRRTINRKNEGVSSYSTFTCTSTSWEMTHIAQNTSEVFTFTDAKRLDNENLQASESMLVSNQADTTNGRPVPAHSPVSLNAVVEQAKFPTPVKLPGQSNLGHSQPSTPEKFTDNRDYMWLPEARIEALIRSKELKAKTRGHRKKEQVYQLNPTCSNANGMVNKTPSCTIDSSNQLRSVNTVASPMRNSDRKKLHLGEASVQDSEMESEIPHKEPIDDIIQMLWYLNINGMYQNFTAVQQNSLVLYARGPGPVVTFDGALSIIKKRRHRAKVDLDPESDRVWKLLMGKETGDGETGVDKEKYWEEERRVYHGRVDSFISRMHSIQGDRRFSQWKGSVLDSIIGVFLTQNVSDHLSSSAYMSLAARFPAKSIGGNQSQNAEKVSSLVALEDAIGEHGRLSEQSSGAPSSAQVHESEQVDLKEMANCKQTIESNTESGVFDYSKGNGLECHQRELQIGHVSREIGSATAVNSTSCMNGVEDLDGRPLEDVASSPNSTVSSQNSSEYIVQEADQSKGNSKFSNGDDLLTSGIGNTGTNSFMELLKLASNGGLQEIDTHHKGRAPMENNGGIDQLTDPSIDQRSSFPDHFGHLGIRQCGIYAEHLNARTTATTATFQQRGTEVTLQVETTQREVKGQLENCIEFNNQKNIFEVTALVDSHLRNQPNISQKIPAGVSNTELKAKKVKAKTEDKSSRHWDSLRRQAFCNGAKKERSSDTMDSMDYEELRNADVNVISHAIRIRGMNNLLAARIKALLNRLVEDHGSTDLEWLRDVPPDQVKDYLLSVRGLGLKSVECVRLLTLHHLAFPVDTNVGRIAVRLGWVPLQNLPDSLQLHLLELYPVMEHIQKYLWPRLCKLDQQTLYELHYQMITFGKVFCTKSKPNCNACPMKGECKHFASAFANSRLLTGPEEKSPASSATSIALEGGHSPVFRRMPLEGGHSSVFRTIPLPQLEESTQSHDQTALDNCEPIIEEPASPEPEYERTLESAIEDAFYDDPDEIPAINLNMEEFTQNLKSYMQQNMDLQDGDISNALVAVTSESASIPMPKLKNVSRLRTEHQVYELPDSHPLLEGMDDREPDDPCPYLLAIWTAGETAHSSEPPKVFCDSQDTTKLCEDNTCFSCNAIREAQAKTVRGTLLIPCRTAMRGSFPLNGTYFQVNEVFADHYSSRNPINVPRTWIWNLPRRTVYFGTSIPTIFKGLATKEIQHCFWRGFVCVRGFDQTTRAPKPLYARLHLPASKATKDKMEAKAAKDSSNMQTAAGNKS